MSYWEYKKEEIQKTWRDFKNWWEDYNWIIGMCGWAVPLGIGVIGTLVNVWIALISVIVAVAWMFIGLTYIIIDAELYAYREWKKKRRKN